MNRPINVLAAPASYLISNKFGGESSVGLELITTLSRCFDVRFHAITDRLLVDMSVPQGVNFVEIQANLSGGILEKAFFRASCFKKALSTIKRERIDLIHQIHNAPINPLAIFPITRDYPFMVGPAFYEGRRGYFEDEDLLRYGRPWDEFYRLTFFSAIRRKLRGIMFKYTESLMKGLMTMTLEASDAIVATTRAAKEFYSNFAQRSKISVIPEGVNLHEFPFSRPPNNSHILSLGAHFKREGFEYLLQSLSVLIKELPNVKLHLLGDGPDHERLRRMSKKLGIDAHIVFHGYVPRSEIPKFYQACRLVVLPSLRKGFGITQLEAMASGRPVVATNTIGYSEVVLDGKTGFLVPIADPTSMSEAIAKIIANYELSCKMGIEGRKLAEEKYDWKVVATQYYAIYRKM